MLHNQILLLLYMQDMLRGLVNMTSCFICPLQVNFLREGCGNDKICQSNLKLSYQFGTRPLTSDLFTPLPKLVSAEPNLSPSNLCPSANNSATVLNTNMMSYQSSSSFH